MSQEHLVEFEDYVAAIRRRRRLIAAVVATFVVLGAAYSLLSTKVYTSESRVSVTPTFDPGEGSSQEVNIDTEQGIARSSAVATIAQGILGTDTSPSDLLDNVTVRAIGESTILAIGYTDTNPDEAFRGADAFARAYLQFRSEQADEATRVARQQLDAERAATRQRIADLEDQLQGVDPGSAEFAELDSRVSALDSTLSGLDRQIQELNAETVDPGTIIDEAEVPEAPSNPGLPLTVAGAGLIGLVVALSATFVLERRNLGAHHGAPETPDGQPAAALAASAPTPAPAVQAAPTAPALPAAPVAPVAPTRTEAPRPEPRPVTAPAEPLPARPVAQPSATDARPQAPRRAPLALPQAGPTAAATPTPPAAATPTAAAVPTAAPSRPAPATAPADRRRRRDPATALTGLGVDVLGTVPRLSNDDGEPAFDAVALGGQAGEALRRLHAELWPRLDRTGARVVFVTSAVERGVTVGLAGGLAATAALAGQDALLIAGDLHHPRLHDRLGLGNDQGLADVLSGQRQLTHVLQGWSGIPTLCVVTAGRPGPDPSSLVRADLLAAQLATIRDEFGLIVIEGPPVGASADATVMASVSDAVVLAVDPRRSAEHELSGAVTALRLAKAPLLGAVVVEARSGRNGAPAAAGAAPFTARS